MPKRTPFDRAAYQREWDAKRVVKGVGLSEWSAKRAREGHGLADLSEVEQRGQIAASTDAHLRDLQNSGGAWVTHNIGPDYRRVYPTGEGASGCGSPAAMCAEAGGAG